MNMNMNMNMGINMKMDTVLIEVRLRNWSHYVTAYIFREMDDNELSGRTTVSTRLGPLGYLGLGSCLPIHHNFLRPHSSLLAPSAANNFSLPPNFGLGPIFENRLWPRPTTVATVQDEWIRMVYSSVPGPGMTPRPGQPKKLRYWKKARSQTLPPIPSEKACFGTSPTNERQLLHEQNVGPVFFLEFKRKLGSIFGIWPPFRP
jgi:hypothetical protein